jgi:hypothetical protein
VAQFAAFADVQERYPGTLDASLEPRVNALLTDASTVVRRYTRQTFVKEQTTENLRPVGGKIKLPHRPVISVDGVWVIDYLENKIPVVLPYWDGGNEIWLLYGQTVINLAEGLRQLFMYNTPLCEVLYTHGYETTPDEVTAVVCSMVIRALSVPGSGAVQSQAGGGFSATLTPAAAAGVLALTQAEKDMLHDFRIKARTVELR